MLETGLAGILDLPRSGSPLSAIVKDSDKPLFKNCYAGFWVPTLSRDRLSCFFPDCAGPKCRQAMQGWGATNRQGSAWNFFPPSAIIFARADLRLIP